MDNCVNAARTSAAGFRPDHPSLSIVIHSPQQIATPSVSLASIIEPSFAFVHRPVISSTIYRILLFFFSLFLPPVSSSWSLVPFNFLNANDDKLTVEKFVSKNCGLIERVYSCGFTSSRIETPGARTAHETRASRFGSQPREHPSFVESPTWNTIARRRNVDSIVAIPSTSSALFFLFFPRFPTGFLFFTRAAPLDCFPCLFLPLRPSPPASRVFSSSVILSPFLPLYSISHSLSFFNHISPSLPRYACTYTIVWKMQVGRIGWSVSHLRHPDSLLYFLFPSLSFLIPFRSLRREQVHSLSRSSFFLRGSLCLLSVLCATLAATVSFFLVVAVLFTPLPSSHERLTSHDDCHLSRSIARRRAAS